MTKTEIVAGMLREAEGRPIATLLLMRRAGCIQIYAEIDRCRKQFGMVIEPAPIRHKKTGRVLVSRFRCVRKIVSEASE